MPSAECWLKTQAVSRTFQPNVDTFNADVVIDNEESQGLCDLSLTAQDDENGDYSRHTERQRKYPVINTKELSCKNSNYIETNKKLDCFGSKGSHNDYTNSVILSESGFADGRRETSPDRFVSPRPLWKRVRVRGEINSEKRGVSEVKDTLKIDPNNVILWELNSCSPQNDCKNICCLSRGKVRKINRKVAFSLAEGATHVAHWKNSRKIAFTLAEVLITLGIIGVVAAITIPTIIQNYKKSVIETSVKRFYTTMNQAIILSERENGDMHNWSRTGYYNDGATTWDKYFDKYVVTIKRQKTKDGKNTIFVFPDGSGLKINSSDFFYCTKADLINKNDNNTSNPQCMLFGFYPNYPVNEPDCVVATYRDKGIEPYINGGVDCSKINDTKTLCESYHYYGRVLQINGWKFPKDCKVKF